MPSNPYQNTVSSIAGLTYSEMMEIAEELCNLAIDREPALDWTPENIAALLSDWATIKYEKLEAEKKGKANA